MSKVFGSKRNIKYRSSWIDIPVYLRSERKKENFFRLILKAFFKERLACVAGGISRAGNILVARKP